MYLIVLNCLFFTHIIEITVDHFLVFLFVYLSQCFIIIEHKIKAKAEIFFCELDEA